MFMICCSEPFCMYVGPFGMRIGVIWYVCWSQHFDLVLERVHLGIGENFDGWGERGERRDWFGSFLQEISTDFYITSGVIQVLG